MGVTISAIGCYKPKVYVSNEIWREKFAPALELGGHEFLRMIGEGVVQRYYAAPEETVVSMAGEAIRNCLEKSHVSPEEIDLIIHAANVSDELSGDCARITRAVGATRAASYEITDVACAGFMVPFFQAVAFIESGLYRNVVVSCVGNAASRGGNMTDWLAAALGELATATLLTPCEGDRGLIAQSHKTLGQHAGIFQFMPLPYGVMAWPRAHQKKYWANLFHFIIPKELPNMQRISTELALEAVEQTLKKADLSFSDIQWLVTHQAGELLSTWRNLFGVTRERHLDTFAEIGNSSMSNIPYTLMKAMEEGKFSAGDKVLLFTPGTGVHLTCGIWKW